MRVIRSKRTFVNLSAPSLSAPHVIALRRRMMVRRVTCLSYSLGLLSIAFHNVWKPPCNVAIRTLLMLHVEAIERVCVHGSAELRYARGVLPGYGYSMCETFEALKKPGFVLGGSLLALSFPGQCSSLHVCQACAFGRYAWIRCIYHTPSKIKAY